MRTSILTVTTALGIAIAVLPAQAQQSTAPGQQQIQSDKQMQEDADKGIKTRDSGESGFVGQQETPGASAHPPGRPDPSSSQSTTGSGAGTGSGSETNRTPR